MSLPIDFGKPKHFDIDLYLDVIRSCVSTLEGPFVKRMLDKVPAYYRDNPTPRMEAMNMTMAYDQDHKQFDLTDYLESAVQMANADEFAFAIEMVEHASKYGFHCEALNKVKRWMWEKLITDEEYAFAEVEPETQHLTDQTWAIPDHYRFHIVDQIVKQYNEQGKAPHVIDFGPASYVLLHGLRLQGRKFTYKPITFQPLSCKPIEHRDRAEFDQPVIYVCCEVIEHLWQEDLVYQYAVKHAFECDMIVLSTPKHTFGGGVDHRRSKYMGHLRTYTPSEFSGFAQKHWPLHAWTYLDSPQMVLVGVKEGVIIAKDNDGACDEQVESQGTSKTA